MNKVSRRTLLKAGLISGAAGLPLLSRAGSAAKGSGKKRKGSGKRRGRRNKNKERAARFFGYEPFTQPLPIPKVVQQLEGGLGRESNDLKLLEGDPRVLMPRPGHYGEDGNRQGPSPPRSVERYDDNGNPIPGTGIGPAGLQDVANGIAPEYGHFAEMVRPDLVDEAQDTYGTVEHAAEFGLVIESKNHQFVPGGPKVPVFSYRDVSQPAGSGSVPGPTVVVKYRQPAVVRCYNLLTEDRETPEWGGQPNDTHHAHETSIHLHGGHNTAHGDGYPDFYTLAGEARDYWYTNCGPQQTNPENNIAPIHGVNDPSLAPGAYEPDGTPASDGNFDQAWIPTTLWYHDHAMDVTGYNVTQGLAGFYLVVSPREESLAEQRIIPQPGSNYDLGLAIRDERFNADGTVFYDKLDHNGHIGDVYLVNGKVQPYFEVERRKYRFRILVASNARVFELRLSSRKALAIIGTDSWLLPEAVEAESIELSPGMRNDIIVDFSDHEAGDKVYLENIMIQVDGRKPKEVDPDNPTKLLEFRVTDRVEEGWDGNDGPPVVAGTKIRGFQGEVLEDGTFGQWAKIESNEVVQSRVFRFDRGAGAWTVNNRYFNPRRSDGDTGLGLGAEQWTMANNAGGWVHPVHTHLEGHQVVTINDEPVARRERAFNQDLTLLHGGDSAEIRVKQRSFTGPFVMHCHTIEHEDMRMMAVLDPQPVEGVTDEEYGLIQDGETLELIDATPPLDGEHEIEPAVSGISEECHTLDRDGYIYFEATDESGAHLFDTERVDGRGVGFPVTDTECTFDMTLRGNRGRVD